MNIKYIKFYPQYWWNLFLLKLLVKGKISLKTVQKFTWVIKQHDKK